MLCGARPGTLSLDSATFEKVDETFNRASRAKCRLFIGDELGFAAHIGAQDLGDIHGAVRVEIVL